jgi:methionyl-tRNA formyltransferase
VQNEKITLYLMGANGLATLRGVVEGAGTAGVWGVVGARDPGVADDAFDAIAALCRERGIAHQERDSKAANASRFALASGWRWLLKEHERTVVLHDSLLPRYRGYAPTVNALINREPQIGVTAFYATERVDAGPIIAQEVVAIRHPMRIAEAIRLLGPAYAKLGAGIVAGLIGGTGLPGVAQDEAGATYSPWRDEKDYFVDWRQSAGDIQRFIYAVGHPYKGAAAVLDGKTVRILDAQLADDLRLEMRMPGKVLFVEQGCPVVACGAGLIRLLDVREDGSNASVMPLKRLRSRFE